MPDLEKNCVVHEKTWSSTKQQRWQQNKDKNWTGLFKCQKAHGATLSQVTV